MGVLCTKPVDGVARGHHGSGDAQLVLTRTPPPSMIAPPDGVLELIALKENNVDQVPFTPTHYKKAFAALRCVSTCSGQEGEASALHKETLDAVARALTDLMGGSRAIAPTPAVSATPGSAHYLLENPNNSSAMSMQDAPRPSQLSNKTNASIAPRSQTFEELAYKALNPAASQARSNASLGGDDDDDEGHTMSHGLVSEATDDDQFEYGSFPTAGSPGGSGANNLLHPGFVPRGGGSQNRSGGLAVGPLQRSPLSPGLKRQLSFSSAFNLDGKLLLQLIHAVTSSRDLQQLAADFPKFFEYFPSCGSGIASPKKSGTTVSVGGFAARSLQPMPFSSKETDVFVSFANRCKMADVSGSNQRLLYHQALVAASQTLSRLILPIVGYLTMSIGRYVMKKKSSSGGHASGRHRTTRRLSHQDDDGPGDSIASCARDALAAFWRLNDREISPALSHCKEAPHAPGLSSKSLAALSGEDVVPFVVSRILKVQFLVGGGWHSIGGDDRRGDVNEDMLLAEALQVEAVNMIVGPLSRAAGYDGTRAMHTTDDAEDWGATLDEILTALGVTPAASSRSSGQRSQQQAAPDNKQRWDTFVAALPHYVLMEDGKQALMYLHAAIQGQKKLHLQPIMRADVLRSVAMVLVNGSATDGNRRQSSMIAGADAAVAADDVDDAIVDAIRNDYGRQNSVRVFPVFATEGVGLESGEGHGPRKELFDLCASDMSAPRSFPVDISSAATFQIVSNVREVSSQRLASGVTIGAQYLGKPVLLLGWKQRKLISAFQNGDVVTIALDRRSGGQGSAVAGDPNSAEHQPTTLNECWTVEGALEAAHAHESIVVLSTEHARIPYGYRVVSCKVELKRTPPFRHDSGNSHAWLNPSFFSACKALQRRAKQQKQFVADHQFDGLSPSAILFAAGWIVGNGVCNGVAAPCAVPPFAFRFLRHVYAAAAAVAEGRGAASHVEPYPESAPDLALVNRSLLAAAEDVMRMSSAHFSELLLADGLPESTTREHYVDTVLVSDSLWNSGDADESRSGVKRFVHGFCATPIANCPVVFRGTCSKQLRSILCGALDEGTGSFSFTEHFRLVEDSEMTAFAYSHAFRDVFWDVMENGFDVGMKRQLLKFVTGRTLLPPRRKAEHIKVELPMSPMVAKEFDRALARLPSSHSCDNVIEIVNLLECLLFCSTSRYYDRAGKTVGSVVLDDHKDNAWLLFSVQEQVDLIRQSKELFHDKLKKAVSFSGTYELDDAAVSKETREAFEHAYAGPASLATAAAPHETTSNNNSVRFEGTVSPHSTPTRTSSSTARFSLTAGVNDTHHFSAAAAAVSPQHYSGTGSSAFTFLPQPSQASPLQSKHVGAAQRATASMLDEFDEPDEPSTYPSSSRHAASNAAAPTAVSSSGMLLRGQHAGPATRQSFATTSVTGSTSLRSSQPQLLPPATSTSTTAHRQHLGIFSSAHANVPQNTDIVDVDADDCIAEDDASRLKVLQPSTLHRQSSNNSISRGSMWAPPGGASQRPAAETSGSGSRRAGDIDHLMEELFPAR